MRASPQANPSRAGSLAPKPFVPPLVRTMLDTGKTYRHHLASLLLSLKH